MSGDRRDLVAAFGYGPRAVCRLCSLAFIRPDDCDSEICEDCVEFEPGPFQDNDAPNQVAIWYGPLQAPEIVVAQEARREAERCAREAFTALSLTIEALTAIAGQQGKPLRLMPRDQSRRAQAALQQFEEVFPDLHEMLNSLPTIQ
jgi:hypothetical protein